MERQYLQQEHHKQMTRLVEGVLCKTPSGMWFSMAEVQGFVKKRSQDKSRCVGLQQMGKCWISEFRLYLRSHVA